MVYAPAWRLVTAPADEVVDLVDLRRHLRVDSSMDDAGLEAVLIAARSAVEDHLQRALAQRTLAVRLDAFDDVIELPQPPLLSVDWIKYLDAAGAEQTMPSSDYEVDLFRAYGALRPAYGKAWPTALAQPGAVRIQFKAGYATPDDVPSAIQAAIRLLAGHLWENREALSPSTLTELPLGFADLLAPHCAQRFI